MASKRRPSYVSIRTRKVRLLNYMGTTGKTEAQTAKDFGVSKSELRRFITQDPKSARRSYNRSPSQRKLFREITEATPRPTYKQGQRVERLKGTTLIRFDARPSVLDQIRRTPGILPEERARRLQIGTLIQRHYVFQDRPEYHWAEYAREHKLPSSINAIKILYRNGRISNTDFRSIASTWKDVYNIDDAWYAKQIGSRGEESVA